MTKSILKTSLIQQVKNQLKEEIITGAVKPGQRIESIRSITQKYKVSHITAAKALKELSKEGWIDSKVGSGSFVSLTLPINNIPKQNASTSSKDTIYYALMNQYDFDGYHSEILSYLQKLSEEYGLNFKLIPAEDTQALSKIATFPRTMGIICRAEMPYFEAEMPVVYYGMSQTHINSNFVQPDNFEGGIVAGKTLLENGHKNICYVSNYKIEDGIPHENLEYMHFRQRYNGLCAIFEMYNYSTPQRVCWHVKDQDSRYNVSKLLEKVKNKDSQAPTALVIGNKKMASEILMVAIGMGIDVPNDLSIVSFVDRGLDHDSHISTIDFSREKMAEQIFSTIFCATKYKCAINHNKHLIPMFMSNQSTLNKLS